MDRPISWSFARARTYGRTDRIEDQSPFSSGMGRCEVGQKHPMLLRHASRAPPSTCVRGAYHRIFERIADDLQ